MYWDIYVCVGGAMKGREVECDFIFGLMLDFEF